MNIPHATTYLLRLCLTLGLLTMCHGKVTASTNALFEQGNDALARGDAQTAIDHYLAIANEQGTSPALAENVATAAEIADEPGLLEWAHRTQLLRNTEWAIITSTVLSFLWAMTIAIGAWKCWPIKRITLTSLPSAIGVAIAITVVQQWMPSAHEAVIVASGVSNGIDPSSPAEPSAEAKRRVSDILLSPFSSAEVIGTLPLGSHVLLMPLPVSSPPPPVGFLYINHPDTQIQGWVHAHTLRRVGE